MHYRRWRKHGDPTVARPYGTQSTYDALHKWMNQEFPRTGRCEHCGKAGRTHYASIEHRYTHDRADWNQFCVFGVIWSRWRNVPMRTV